MLYNKENNLSATPGVLIRLVVMSGILTTVLSLAVVQVKAARGTLVAMVGTRAYYWVR
jgi:hypothetical protein